MIAFLALFWHYDSTVLYTLWHCTVQYVCAMITSFWEGKLTLLWEAASYTRASSSIKTEGGKEEEKEGE